MNFPQVLISLAAGIAVSMIFGLIGFIVKKSRKSSLVSPKKMKIIQRARAQCLKRGGGCATDPGICEQSDKYLEMKHIAF